MPEVVRRPLQVRESSRRTLDQRLAIRFPWLSAAGFRLVTALPPSSRIRQAGLQRTIRMAIEAYNRRDLEAVVASWDPDFVYVPDRKWIDAGLVSPRYRGFAGYREYVAAADEVWGGANYLKPLELVDLGTRLVVLAEGTMRAQASGVPLTEAYAVVLTLDGGRVVEVQEYFDHATALKAVGLDN